MVKRKSDDEVFKDEDKEQQSEEYSDDPERSHIRKPPAYRDMTDAQYIKVKRREDFAMLGRGDKHNAVEYLRRYEGYFRKNYTQEEKEVLHRSILWNGRTGLTQEDINLLRDVFGSLRPCTMKPSNTQVAEKSYTFREPQSPSEWMKELKYSTFVRFRKSLNNPQFKLSVLDKLDEDGKDMLCDAIEYQLQMKYVLQYQAEEGLGFKDEDMIWINQI